jgi:hypothetical protein
VISVAPDLFRRQMEALAASRVKVVPLEAIFEHPGAVAITFDDGFVNVAEHAAPVLERLALPATVFVVSGYCGKRNNWPTQPAGIPQLPLMDWTALRGLPPLFSLGAHTVNHPDLSGLDRGGYGAGGEGFARRNPAAIGAGGDELRVSLRIDECAGVRAGPPGILHRVWYAAGFRKGGFGSRDRSAAGHVLSKIDGVVSTAVRFGLPFVYRITPLDAGSPAEWIYSLGQGKPRVPIIREVLRK